MTGSQDPATHRDVRKLAQLQNGVKVRERHRIMRIKGMSITEAMEMKGTSHNTSARRIVDLGAGHHLQSPIKAKTSNKESQK